MRLNPMTVDESIAALKATTLEDAKRCYRELFGASRAEFAAVGDFDADALARQVDELFGAWHSPVPFKR